ncbi:hypothetical protein DPMN_170822 [Dreissena polymorpha]|uniref:BED-type domain-containing protein n=1 Tax=Dreissena polymorpha TaxID=45954 RepID=A0A9D4IDJ8_DREPO|nr:hypothetical protein DPMN_170822 [Dreissena polymorpha]
MANETCRGKKSSYWNFLTKIEVCGKEKVKCNFTNLCATYKGGSTWTMANHIKMVHKSVGLDAAKTSADDSEKQQRKLTDFAKPTMTHQKWIVCREKLALMCARDLRPISIVN